jgi:hypothetical protein
MESQDLPCESILKGRNIMGQIGRGIVNLATLKKEVGMFCILLTTFMIPGTFGGQAIAGEFLDSGTDTRSKPLGTHDIHTCRGGSFMVGVHVGKNIFLCDDSFGYLGKTYSPSDLTDQRTPTPAAPNISPFRPYESHGMAACPPGKAMVGLHVGRNVLLCAPLQTRDLFVDEYTQTSKGLRMHRCPEGSVMVGIHVGRNLLLCGRVR